MFKIEDLILATRGEFNGNSKVKAVSGVSIDSREIRKGECFVALRGAHFDGQDFIKEAVSRGASLIVCSEDVSVSENIAAIKVSDPIEALGDIASFWREQFHVPCVAITGSNGKSTTKQMTAAALSPLGSILKTEGNFNNLIGLPLSVLRWTKKHKAAVLEMGMNAPGEITKLTEIARPQVGLITNVCSAHLERLHTIENVARAKGELFETMGKNGVIVVNLEDKWVRELAAHYKGEKFTFGMKNNADVRFGRMQSVDLGSIDMTVYVGGKEFEVHLKIPGTHNVMNVMAAISVSRVLGVKPEKAIREIEKFEPMSMRMERVQLLKGVQLVNDCYNANPLSVKEALRTVSGAKRAGRLIAVLGDMLELGDNAPACHREVGEAASKYLIDKLFVFGDYAKDTAAGAKSAGMNSGKVVVYDDMEKLKDDVADFINTGDIVLVKGSRGMKMERVAEHLKDIIGVE